MLHLLLYVLCISLAPSQSCDRQWAQSLPVCYNSARVGPGDVKYEHNLEKWIADNICHNSICGLPKYHSFLSFFKRKGPSLTASHSVKPPLQLWCCHEARSHNSDMSFDLEMNHVRKQDRSRTSILLGQVTQRCGCCAGHSRGNVALGVVAAAILLSD